MAPSGLTSTLHIPAACCGDFPRCRRPSARAAFTLVELLIVVTIIGILAAAVIPQFTSSTDDAREGTLAFNEHELQKILNLYMVQHGGTAPMVVKASLPQLLSGTNVSGEIGASGPSYPFGPYLQGSEMPMNPVVESNTVLSVAKFPPAVKGGSAGWFYHEPTGQIMANRGVALSEADIALPITP